MVSLARLVPAGSVKLSNPLPPVKPSSRLIPIQAPAALLAKHPANTLIIGIPDAPLSNSLFPACSFLSR
jgi:hypothetical protein